MQMCEAESQGSREFWELETQKVTLNYLQLRPMFAASTWAELVVKVPGRGGTESSLPECQPMTLAGRFIDFKADLLYRRGQRTLCSYPCIGPNNLCLAKAYLMDVQATGSGLEPCPTWLARASGVVLMSLL